MMQVMRRTGTPLRYAPVNAFTAVLFDVDHREAFSAGPYADGDI
jgi:hypothetical protein